MSFGSAAAPVLAPDALPAGLASILRKDHLPSLDGLRAIAAFLVVFGHCGLHWVPDGLGVLAFFVLSGFLITWLLLKEEESSGTVSLKYFYMRRSLRIFPAFYAYWILVTGFLLVMHKHILWAQSCSSLFYVNNYYQALHGDPNTGFSHTWSLGIEEQFYLLWPLTFLLLKRTRRRIWFLVGGILSVWIYRELLVFVVHRHEGYIYEAFDTRADHLMIGCLLAILLRGRWLAGLWRAICSSPLLIWATLSLLAVSSIMQAHFGPLYRDPVGFIVDPLLVAVLLVQAIAFPATGFAVFLNWRWMRYLGNISYSVYLYQQMISGESPKIAKWFPHTHWLVIPALVIVAASCSYWIIEKPFLRLKRRWEPPRRAAAPPPAMARAQHA